MEPVRPPDNGLNFFLPWGFLEWAITGVMSVSMGVALWVARLGSRSTALEQRMVEMEKRLMDSEMKAAQIEVNTNRRHDENIEKLSALKEELLNRLADLPSRHFIETQNNQLTQRLDRLADSRARGN